MKRIYYFLIAIICISCTYYDNTFPYDFENVTELIELDGKMQEVSGLFYKNDKTLYAVKDEEGEIFEVNLESGEHKKIIDFKKEGDFEGIAKAGKHFYALKSDGDVYKIEDGSDDKFTFSSDKKGWEFEGLTVDAKGKNLLVACKNHGDKDKNDKIYIYPFSIGKKEYLKKEAIVIDKKDIHENFKTSAISLAPNGNLFIVSAISFTIAEINMEGKVIQKAQLPFLMYNQVEGMCFDKAGNLFLASEKGDQDRAKIIKLNKI